MDRRRSVSWEILCASSGGHAPPSSGGVDATLDECGLIGELELRPCVLSGQIMDCGEKLSGSARSNIVYVSGHQRLFPQHATRWGKRHRQHEILFVAK